MLQLEILSGKKAGVIFNARRFPVRLGRAASNELVVDDDGVWDAHCEIALQPDEGFTVTAQADAMLQVNGEPVRDARLRNGDILTAGSARIAFRIGEAKQQRLGLVEAFVWALFAAVTAAEMALVYLYLP